MPSDSRGMVGDTTVDAFVGGALAIEQPARGYRAGLDAVLLAAAVDVARRPRRGPGGIAAADVGAGVGTAGLCLAARLSDLDVTLIERDPVACRLALANIARNRLGARTRVVRADVFAPSAEAPAELVRPTFDIVLSNPPYLEAGHHRPSPDRLKRASHAMPAAGLDGWLRFIARITRPGGLAVVIHRADRLAELLAALSGRFGGAIAVPLHPRPDAPASRVIISAVKGSRAPLCLAPGIVLHEADGSFRPDVKAALAGPVSLSTPLSAAVSPDNALEPAGSALAWAEHDEQR